jgi:hypothetical protein
VGSTAATPVLRSIRPEYRPHGPDPLRTLFRQRFPAFQASYEQRYAAFFGKFRLPLISRAASAFRLCGDWSQGIARIRCPDCGYDLFRPFSCKSFFLCASCAQKRTLLLGEYLSENLLLCLPHRQFVWTIPKVLRVFLRHDRQLFADIGRLLYDILTIFFTQAAGRSIRTAMVSSHQTFGEFAAWHPHWHAIVLEGGFDSHDRFFFVPLGANEALTEIWRRRVVALFLSKGLLNPDFAGKLLNWRHSGFSIESGTRIYDQEARQALSQYIVRPPLSLEKIHWDQEQDTVTWKSSPSGYFRGREKHFSALDFIAQLTLHIPPRGRHLVRRYGLYSSRGRGTWKDRPALRARAPQHWYGRQAAEPPTPTDAPKDQEVSTRSSRKAWARLLAKVYELDVMACPKCGSRMAVIAVILDPAEIRKIIACLAKHGRGPPTVG